MDALIVCKTSNGYAVVPFTGTLENMDMDKMAVATRIKTYTYSGGESVCEVLERHFEKTENAA